MSEPRGTSPVVGVILMVAMVVILTAAIGSFVLDLGEGPDGERGCVQAFGEGAEFVDSQYENGENVYICEKPNGDFARLTDDTPCRQAFGEGAVKVGSYYDDDAGAKKLICELPSGDLRSTEGGGR